MEEKEEKPGTGPVEPTRLTGKSRLRFACHRGLDCFTKCCHGMVVQLAPYDIFRLKRRLGLSSGEFLSRHTRSSLHEPSALPTVTLRMGEDEGRTCSFLTPEGCSVYTDRPAICRYYPIGLASLKLQKETRDEPAEDRFYFLIREDHCLGHGEDKEWTIDSWRDDQGISTYDEFNRDWMSAFLRRSVPGAPELDPRQQALFHMACYDLDTFRRFVFESPFLDRFEVEPERVQKIRRDEEELLRFALEYMKFFLGIEETIGTKEGVLEKWAERKKKEEPSRK